MKQHLKGTGSVYKRSDSTYWWVCYSHHGKTFRESTGTEDEAAAYRYLLKR